MSPLDLLPARTAGAAENMAADFLLLQRYPAARAAHPRFRRYDWRRPAFTFGYSQKIAAVRDHLAAVLGPEPDALRAVELCRRPTGGGLVDHRDDWTYALVIPRGHPLEEQRASASYRAIHEALADALVRQSVAALLQPCPADDCTDADAPPAPPASPAGVCFERAEIFDVIHAVTRTKIAGAAQKRNKHGLLFQGSILRPTVGALDWDRFETDFVSALAQTLAADPTPTGWPDFDEEETSALTDHYASPEWTEFR